MTEDKEGSDPSCDTGSKTFINKNKDKKPRLQKPLTKIIVRRLPPTMSEASFLEQVSPIPEHDYFYFAKPDLSMGNTSVFSRAYINFLNVEDIFLFRDKFDGYVFLDDKGVEYVGIVEYAPFQRIPKKKKKKDPKCGTIESDPVYQEFVEFLTKEPETENQPKLEYSYPMINDGSHKKVQSTPLLDYLAARKQDKRGRDERRRRENDKRKMRVERKVKEPSIKEDEAEETEYKKIKPRDWDKDKGSSKYKDDKDTTYESKTFRDRKSTSSLADRKKKDADKKEEFNDEGNKKDITKESPREQKSKKYSDSRKDRTKTETVKSDKVSKPETKSKLPNHNDIKPFTQLPQVKTDDLAKIIDSMDRKLKMEEKNKKGNDAKSTPAFPNARRNSLESCERSEKEESPLKRQNSLEDRSKSTDREGSEEKDKSDSGERRSDRRIRNKDRPSMVIYQPGMGRFSKQRLAKDKDSPSSNAEDKDT